MNHYEGDAEEEEEDEEKADDMIFDFWCLDEQRRPLGAPLQRMQHYTCLPQVRVRPPFAGPLAHQCLHTRLH